MININLTNTEVLTALKVMGEHVVQLRDFSSALVWKSSYTLLLNASLKLKKSCTETIDIHVTAHEARIICMTLLSALRSGMSGHHAYHIISIIEQFSSIEPDIEPEFFKIG